MTNWDTSRFTLDREKVFDCPIHGKQYAHDMSVGSGGCGICKEIKNKKQDEEERYNDLEDLVEEDKIEHLIIMNYTNQFIKLWRDI